MAISIDIHNVYQPPTHATTPVLRTLTNALATEPVDVNFYSYLVVGDLNTKHLI